MNRFFLALAFVAAAPAIWASPVPCSTKAKPLIDVDHRYNNAPDGVDLVFHLLDSGAWTLKELDLDRTPPALVEVKGCFDAPAMSSLKGKLARATWKVTHRDPCTAMKMDAQSYAVGGKQVWVAMQCSGEQLDAASANAIHAIDALLEAARSANKKQP
jgi:hypothetical protein